MGLHGDLITAVEAEIDDWVFCYFDFFVVRFLRLLPSTALSVHCVLHASFLSSRWGLALYVLS
jgi:hypothetical protein